MDKELLAGFVVDIFDRLAVYEITKDIKLLRPALNSMEKQYKELKTFENPTAYTPKEKAFIKCFDSLKAAFEIGFISMEARAFISYKLDILSSGLIL